METQTLAIKEVKGVPFVQFPHLNDTGLVAHGFSTRHGGVSQGVYSTMNLGFFKEPSREVVFENFSRFTSAIGVTMESLVFSNQIHETVVRQVGLADCGKGLSGPSDIKGVDGLMTNEPGVTLTTFYADCVPLFFVDPKNKAIALSHAGWRGTVKGIGPITVRKMAEAFGSKPEDLLIGIGPSIGGCCYEVTKEVIEEFQKVLDCGIIDKIARRVDQTHWMMDLWAANRYLLIEAGVQEEQIVTTDLCTKCHSDDFYSHRVMGVERGSLSGMLALKAHTQKD